MIIFRQNNHEEHLKVESYKFKKVHNFKCLSIIINTTHNTHEEIEIRTTAYNKWYYRLYSVLNQKLYCIRPVLLYTWEKYPTSKDEEKLVTTESKIPFRTRASAGGGQVEASAPPLVNYH